MIDRDNVIKGMVCHKRAMYGDIDEHGFACNLCPYKDMEDACRPRTEGKLIADALTLLEAQEPIDGDTISRSALLAAYDAAHKCHPGGTRKLIEEAPAVILKAQVPKPPIIKENSYGWKFYYCPSCGKEFYQNNKFSFCEKCGQAVKWE